MGEGHHKGMDRFVSTFTNKIDAKGRVSIPASFRAVLTRDSYAGGEGSGIYCYPSLDAPALDAGGERLAKKIDGLLSGLPDYSDERDQLSVALYSDVQVLNIDGDGRIVLPPALRQQAGITTEVTFVGMGDKFQIWEPKAFEAYRASARDKVQEHRRLFADRSGGPVERAPMAPGQGGRSPAGEAAMGERGNDGAQNPAGQSRGTGVSGAPGDCSTVVSGAAGGVAAPHSRAPFAHAGGVGAEGRRNLH